MIAYLKRLNAGFAEYEARRAEQRRAKEERVAQTARERLSPLEDRLVRLLATIPVEIQHEGLSLPTLQASLKGHRQGHCHPGELGAALRKLGFKRERRWRGDAGFRAAWRKQA